MSDDLLNVTIADGKYTVVQDAAGRLSALRYGQPWRDCCGDQLVFALASELTAERDARKTAEQSLDEITHDWQTEIVALRQAEKRAEQEKQSRLKYQGIVYAVANQLDRHLGNKPGSGLLVVEIPAAVETVLAKFQDTDALGRFKNLLAESVALAEKGNTIDDLKKRAEDAEKACASVKAWRERTPSPHCCEDCPCGYWLDEIDELLKDASSNYVPKSKLDAQKAVADRFAAIIHACLLTAGVPEYHPNNGAPARKPMMPQEQIEWLAAKRDEAIKALEGCIGVLHKLDVYYCPLCLTGSEVEHKEDCLVSKAIAAAEKVTGQ